MPDATTLAIRLLIIARAYYGSALAAGELGYGALYACRALDHAIRHLAATA